MAAAVPLAADNASQDSFPPPPPEIVQDVLSTNQQEQENEYAYISDVLPPPPPPIPGGSNNLSDAEKELFLQRTPHHHQNGPTCTPPAPPHSSRRPEPKYKPVQCSESHGGPSGAQKPHPMSPNIMPRLLAHECALAVKGELPNYGATRNSRRSIDGDNVSNAPTYFELESDDGECNYRFAPSTHPSHRISPNKIAKIYATQRNM